MKRKQRDLRRPSNAARCGKSTKQEQPGVSSKAIAQILDLIGCPSPKCTVAGTRRFCLGTLCSRDSAGAVKKMNSTRPFSPVLPNRKTE